MFSFIKKIFGFPTEEEKALAQAPVVNSKSGDVVEMPAPKVDPVAVALDLEGVKLTNTVVNPQITDAVTQAEPVKKTRKPRVAKTEKVVKEKAAKPVKVAAKRTVTRSKKT